MFEYTGRVSLVEFYDLSKLLMIPAMKALFT